MAILVRDSAMLGYNYFFGTFIDIELASISIVHINLSASRISYVLLTRYFCRLSGQI